MSLAATIDDPSLLAKIQLGDEDAMTILFDRYSPVIYSVALRVLSDPASASDVLHDVSMLIWRNADSFAAARGSLGGWLALLARNRSIDALRRKRPADTVDDIVLASTYNVSSDADRVVFLDRAREAVGRIPADQRKTFEMAFFDGLHHNEIAEMTGDPAPIVKSRIRGSILTLRKAFHS